MRQTIWCGIFVFLTLARAVGAVSEWEQKSYNEFIKGEVEKISITNRGELRLAPQISEVYDTTEPYIWCAVADLQNNIFLGTGNNGKVFKVTPAGKGAVFFDTEELEVTALAVDKDGSLFVGTSPAGKIYRVTPDGKSTVYFDPSDTYIWVLLTDEKGMLYAATGDSGKIYKISAKDKGEILYSSKELNISAMIFDLKGNLIIGTDGKGYIARLSPSGEIFILHDTTLRQVHALAVAKDGVIYAAAIDDRQQYFGGATPPKDKPGTDPKNKTVDNAPDDDPAWRDGAAGGAIVMPPAEVYGGQSSDHALFRIDPDGMVRQIQTSKKHATLAIAIDSNGQLILGTGDDGKFYTVDERGKITLLVKIKEAQVTAFAKTRDGKFFAASSNLGKLFKFDPALSTKGTFTSEPLDAGMFARWGRIAWDGDLQSGAVKVFTRSGNTEKPDATWSDWSAAYSQAAGQNITSPMARMIQYKLELAAGDKGQTPFVNMISIVYKQRNVAPVLKTITLDEPGQGPGYGNAPSFDDDDTEGGDRPAVSEGNPFDQGDSFAASKKSKNTTQPKKRGLQSVRWVAQDDNGDKLLYDAFFKGVEEKSWKELVKNLPKTNFSWITEQMPDGAYMLKIVANDETDNPLSEVMKDSLESASFIIDNTPPNLKNLTANVTGKKARLTFSATDDLSSLDRVEYAVNLGKWRTISPTDFICDTGSEDFNFETEELSSGEQYIVIRATDSLENQRIVKKIVVVP